MSCEDVDVDGTSFPDRAARALVDPLYDDGRGTITRAAVKQLIVLAIRQALGEAATVARGLPLRWDAASMDEVVRNREAVAAAIEALKT